VSLCIDIICVAVSLSFHPIPKLFGRVYCTSNKPMWSRDYHRRGESISVNFATDNEGRENGSEKNVTPLLLSVVYVPSQLINSSQGPLLSFPSISFFAFIGFYACGPESVFCQVSPIKFALRGHLRTPSLLRNSVHERNGSSHKNFTLAASERFSQLFFSPSLPRRSLLLSAFPYSRCFREKSLSFMRLATRSRRVRISLSILRFTRRNVDSAYVRSVALPEAG
jgi:hypothetical protein